MKFSIDAIRFIRLPQCACLPIHL